MGELLIPIAEWAGGIIGSWWLASKTNAGPALAGLLSRIPGVGRSLGNQIAHFIELMNASHAPAQNASHTSATIRWLVGMRNLIDRQIAAQEHIASSGANAAVRIVESIIPRTIHGAIAPVDRDLSKLAHGLAQARGYAAAQVERIDRDLSALAHELSAGQIPTVGSITGSTLPQLAAQVAALDTWVQAHVGSLAAQEASDWRLAQSRIAALVKRVGVLEHDVAAGVGVAAHPGGVSIPAELQHEVGAVWDWVRTHGAAAAAAGVFAEAVGVHAMADAAKCLEDWCGNKGSLLGLLDGAGDWALLLALLAAMNISPDELLNASGQATGALTKWLA